ncbi:NUDIX domain-containing protein [Streptomyces sp. TRM64462]|uniref:NUDIX hydrolase n=1 Tax=Streptomyces sp. TRM64462 TaxID=2741726 RepID=UPI0015863DA3|nr:NUDIX domain-containing protein [Streptomyces sp. TRM64462]
MATPDFIKAVRASAGHQLLLLPGVTAVVVDDEDRVLLMRRADDGKWALVGGIAEPGEQPAVTAVREVYEETGVECVAERVVMVAAQPEPVTYPNGDQCQYMDIVFRCRATGGEARVNDDEALEVAWFPVDALPKMHESLLFRIKQARTDEPTWFSTTAQQ